MTSLPTRLAPPPHESPVTARLPESMLVNAGNPATSGNADDGLGCAPPAYRDIGPGCAVVYRIETGDRRQTGVLIEASVEGYRTGRIRQHESTHPARVRALTESATRSGFEHVPVMLTYRDAGRLAGLLAGHTRVPPDARHTSEDGTTHTVWITRDTELVRAIGNELATTEPLYIADGHHRMAAADWGAGPEPGPAFTLAALFPASELQVCGYHRCVGRPPGMSTADVLAALRACDVTGRIEEYDQDPPPSAPGSVGVYADGRWYRLWLRPDARASGIRDTLDVVALDEGVLAPVFGLTDLNPHPTRGDTDPRDLGRWCAARDTIGFAVHPPTVEEVLAVADAGFVLGPKSTWFAPKAATGLFGRKHARFATT